MKCKSYFGQPPERPCLHFENIEALKAYLEGTGGSYAGKLCNENVSAPDKAADTKSAPKSEAVMVQSISHRKELCVCGVKGKDGTSRCSMPPHLNKVRLGRTKSYNGTDVTLISCDNHLEYYLGHGWEKGTRLCKECCTNEAPDDVCEPCLERLTKPKNELDRIKDGGFCLNRDLEILGCGIYSDEGKFYCGFCIANGFDTDRANRDVPAPAANPLRLDEPHIRLLPETARPCKLSKDCAGRMTASVRRYGQNSLKNLWWHCDTCKTRMIATMTRAMLAPKPAVEPAVEPAAEPSPGAESSAASKPAPIEDEVLKEPLNSDIADMSTMIKTMDGMGE